jgi:Fe-S oxidoreductase/nitrate reductase gamma subunit
VTAQPATVAKPALARADWKRWGRGAREFLLHAVVQDRVLQRIYPGVMHFLLFWGVTIQVLGTAINLVQTDLFLPFTLPFPKGAAYLGFELVMDIAGVMIIAGALMALFRRLVLRPASLISRWDDWLAIGLLLLIPILGFTTEGIRLEEVQPAWRAWSPIGSLSSLGLVAMGLGGAAGMALHPWMVVAHAVSGLTLVALMPFTKLRHLVTGPLNIVLRPERKTGALEKIENIEEAEKLGVGQVSEFSGQTLLSFDACVQCGRCETVCPATISGMPYNPRTLVRSLYENLHANLDRATPQPLLGGALSKETPWACTTCGACLSVCPMFIDQVSAVVELRRYLTLTTGEVPGSVGEALTQIERRGNPWGIEKSNRAPWVTEEGIRVIQPGEKTDVLLFVGCAYSYDSRSQQAGRELARLLKKAGVDFAVLGQAEGCCGETARRLGHEYLFQTLAQQNIVTLGSIEFQSIVTGCAHCYNTLKNEYPQLGGTYPVIHHTELLAELVAAGRLALKADTDGANFVYHDSCYLGRYNDMYTAPRDLLQAVPGLQRTEMPRRRANGFCCGGGGGQMWMETDPNTRINRRRLQEAMVQAHADVVVTACPYCLIMFDDAIRSTGVGEKVTVQDVAEVLTRHLET